MTRLIACIGLDLAGVATMSDAHPVDSYSRPLREESPVTVRPRVGAKHPYSARLFGYDLFLSFALGPAPRGTLSYASDLARKLRESDFTVFFSEDEAPPGEQLDRTLRRALLRSKSLVVIVNRDTLKEPRWVREEVLEFRKHHPTRPPVTVNIGGALQVPELARSAEEWLAWQGTIWVDETDTAASNGIASTAVVDRLATAQHYRRSNRKWRWLAWSVSVALVTLTISLGLALGRVIVAKKVDNARLQRLYEERAVRSIQDHRFDLAAHNLANSLLYGDSASLRGLMVATTQRIPRTLWETPAPLLGSHFKISSRENALLASFNELNLRLLNLPELTDAAAPMTAPCAPLGVEFNFDGSHLLAYCMDRTLSIKIGGNSRTETFSVPALQDSAGATFSPDGRMLLAFISSKTSKSFHLYLRELETQQDLVAPTRNDSEAIAAVFYGKGQFIAVAWKDRTVSRHATGSPDPLPGRIQFDSDIISLEALKTNAQDQLIVATADGHLYKVDASGVRTAFGGEDQRRITGLSSQKNGPFVTVVRENGAVSLWNTETGERMWEIELGEMVIDASSTADGQIVAAVLDDRRPGTNIRLTAAGLLSGSPRDRPILFLDEAGKQIGTDDRRVVRALSFSTDGRFLSYTQGSSIIIRDARTGEVVYTVRRPVRGRLIAIASNALGICALSDLGELVRVELNTWHVDLTQLGLKGVALKLAVHPETTVVAVADTTLRFQFAWPKREPSPVRSITSLPPVRRTPREEAVNLLASLFRDSESGALPAMVFTDKDKLILAGVSGAALLSTETGTVLDTVPYTWQRSTGISAYRYGSRILIGTPREQLSLSAKGARLLVKEERALEGTSYLPETRVVTAGEFFVRTRKVNGTEEMIEILHQDDPALISESADALAVHESGLVAAALEDGRIRVFDADSLRRGRVSGTGGFPYGYSGIAWLAKPSKLLLGRATGLLLVDPASQLVEQVFANDGRWSEVEPLVIVVSPSGKESAGACYAISLSPDGHWLTYLRDDRLIAWDLRDMRHFEVRLKMEAWKTKSIFGEGDTVWLMDTEADTVQRVSLADRSVEVLPHNPELKPTAIVKWGTRVVIGYKTGNLQMVSSSGKVDWMNVIESEVSGLTIRDGRLMVAGKHGEVLLLDEHLAIVAREKPLARITAISASPKGLLVAIAGVDEKSIAAASAGPEQVLGAQQFMLLDKDLRSVAAIPAGQNWFTQLSFDTSARYLAGITYAGNVKIVDLAPLGQSHEKFVDELVKWTNVTLRNETDFIKQPATRWGTGGARTPENATMQVTPLTPLTQ